MTVHIRIVPGRLNSHTEPFFVTHTDTHLRFTSVGRVKRIFKLDIDTCKVKKHAPGVGLGFLEDLIRARFTVVHTDVLGGNTPGHVLYVEKRL